MDDANRYLPEFMDDYNRRFGRSARPIRRSVAASGALSRARYPTPCRPHLKPSTSCPMLAFPLIHGVLQAANRPAPCGPTTPQSPFGSGHVCLAEPPDTNAWF
jgi:hypothetical protein